MRTLIITLVICCCLLINIANAGPGHEHEHGHSHGPISSAAVEGKALKKVQQLAQSGKIDSSWSNKNPLSVEQKSFAKGPEWVITFKNEQLTDMEKQNLFLFFRLDGHYIGANYTGE